MKIENQVCLLWQSFKLKELGVSQDHNSLYYSSHSSKFYLEIHAQTNNAAYVLVNNLPKEGFNGFVSAFTVAELGLCIVDLPDECYCNSEYNHVWKKWQCFLSDKNLDEQWQTEGATEAIARASMLIYLLENKLTTVEEVNARLQNS